MDVEDFDGCALACRPRSKPWKHTLVWGECALAPESARPEPQLMVMRRRIAEDGYPALVGESITLSELAERIVRVLRDHVDEPREAIALAVAVDLIEEQS